MAATLAAEPLLRALEHAERDGLRGEAALLRAFELALAEGVPGSADLVGALREVLAKPRATLTVPPEALASAREAVSALENLDQSDRIQRIARSRRTYRGVAIGEALLDRSRQELPANGEASGQWAECALRALRWTKDTEDHEVLHVFALEARAWAYRANSLRVACDLRAAEKTLEQALRTLECHEVVDLATRAEVREIAAGLQRAQRRTAEAVEGLRWSAGAWEALRKRPEQARVLATLAMTLQIAGEPEEALRACREGLAIAAEIGNRRIEWHLKHNEFEILDELGQHRQARLVAAEVHGLGKPFEDSFTRLRAHWLDGRVARAEGRLELAVEQFRKAQAGFLADHNPYVAAIVSIDLATLHLESGRYREAAELATAMAATFDALGVQREAWAACRLFADACEGQRASVALAKQLARYLDLARQDPEYGFPASALVG